MANSYGTHLRLKIYGESHAPAIGMTLENFPAGFAVDMDALAAFLARRAPGNAPWATPRKEADAPRFLSGLTGGITDGGCLRAEIYNTNVRPGDYETSIPRPGHADYPAYVKYGHIASGGGRFSGRMTAPLCIAGGICLQYLRSRGIVVGAHALAIGGVCDEVFDPMAPRLSALEGKAFPVLDDAAGEKMQQAIAAARAEGDSVGGIIECAVTGLPVGLGEHMFDGMENRIAAIVFAIPAVKGVDFGAGFSSAYLRGSENNDPYAFDSGRVRLLRNRSGGVLGGMTTGMPLIFQAAVKPTPSIAKAQQSVDLKTGQSVELKIRGRHDPCIVPRAVPVVEAAAALAVCDALLQEEEEKE